MEGFYRQNGQEKEISSKECIVSDLGPLLSGMEEVFGDHLTSTEQEITDWLRLHSWERLKP